MGYNSPSLVDRLWVSGFRMGTGYLQRLPQMEKFHNRHRPSWEWTVQDGFQADPVASEHYNVEGYFFINHKSVWRHNDASIQRNLILLILGVFFKIILHFHKVTFVERSHFWSDGIGTKGEDLVVISRYCYSDIRVKHCLVTDAISRWHASTYSEYLFGSL